MWFEFSWASSFTGYFRNALCEYLLCARHHEGSFFHSPILACNSLARNGVGFLIIHIRTLRLKDLLSPSLFYFKRSPILPHTQCDRHCQGIEMNKRVPVFGAYVLIEKIDFKLIIMGKWLLWKAILCLQSMWFLCNCFHCLSGFFWSLRLAVGMEQSPSETSREEGLSPAGRLRDTFWWISVAIMQYTGVWFKINLPFWVLLSDVGSVLFAYQVQWRWRPCGIRSPTGWSSVVLFLLGFWSFWSIFSCSLFRWFGVFLKRRERWERDTFYMVFLVGIEK